MAQTSPSHSEELIQRNVSKYASDDKRTSKEKLMAWLQQGKFLNVYYYYPMKCMVVWSNDALSY